MSSKLESRTILREVASGYANLCVWLFAILPAAFIFLPMLFGTNSTKKVKYIIYPPEFLGLVVPAFYMWILLLIRFLSARIEYFFHKKSPTEEPPITSFMLEHFALRVSLIFVPIYFLLAYILPKSQNWTNLPFVVLLFSAGLSLIITHTRYLFGVPTDFSIPKLSALNPELPAISPSRQQSQSTTQYVSTGDSVDIRQGTAVGKVSVQIEQMPPVASQQSLPPAEAIQFRPNGIKLITLSNHTQDMLSAAANKREQKYTAAHHAFERARQKRQNVIQQYRDDLTSAWQRKDKWGLLKGLWNLAFGVLPPDPTPPIKDQVTQQEEVWASGNRGEEAVTRLLDSKLSDDWTLLSGYHGPKGEIDLLLIGSSGVTAIEVKNINGEVSSDGDRWWRDKFDNYGNLKESNVAIVDKGGRSPSRQLNEATDFLQTQVHKYFGPMRIRRAVILSHDKSRIGSVQGQTVDYVCTLANVNISFLTGTEAVLESSRIHYLLDVIRRDHAHHERRFMEKDKTARHR